MNSSLKRQLLKTFAQMIADLKDAGEVEKFMTDFFDDDEMEKYIKRLATIYWVKKGRDTENIKRNLLATAKEINLSKEKLEKPGIKLAIKKIEAEEWANQWAEKFKVFSSRKGR